MPNSDAHIVRSYSDELQNISALVAKMGGLAETISDGCDDSTRQAGRGPLHSSHPGR